MKSRRPTTQERDGDEIADSAGRENFYKPKFSNSPFQSSKFRRRKRFFVQLFVYLRLLPCESFGFARMVMRLV
jgi:hypothetical protein